jgi:hypothetical protein
MAEPAVESDHMWRMLSMSFDDRGALTEYVCDLCQEHLEIGPGGVHPEEC